jgi:hypothetical protein
MAQCVFGEVVLLLVKITFAVALLPSPKTMLGYAARFSFLILGYPGPH